MWKYTPQNNRDKTQKTYRWVKSPLCKYSDKKWRLRRDYIIIVWQAYPLKYEIKMFPCEDRVVVNTVDQMNRTLEDIASLTKVADVKTIVLVQNMDAFLQAYEKEYEFVGKPRESNGIKYNFCAISEKFEFRNLEPLVGEREIYTVQDVVEVLVSYNRPVYKIVWSMAHMSMKAFYTQELRKSCAEDVKKNKRYFNDVNIYNDMFAGSSSGRLYLAPDHQKVILNNVSAFDKKSAYPWVFVTNNKFPLTKVRRCGYMDFLKAYENDKWFLIVLRGVDLEPKWDYFRAKGDEHSYAWNNYDYKTTELLPDLWNLYDEVITKYDCKFYTASKCGYLLEPWRRHYVDLYNIKNSYKDKEDPDRVQYKTQLDMMYGKGIQFYGYETDDEVVNHYKHRPDHYMLPQWSKMAVSALKYELTRTYLYDDEQFYADTDGTKSTKDKEYLKDLYLRQFNDEISKINKKAGFAGCDIGFWDYEYTADRFIALAKKQYAYEIDGKYTYTISGPRKNLLEDQMRYVEDPLKFLAEGNKIKKQSGLIYVKKEKLYLPKYNDYIIGDNYIDDEVIL